mmetsp:Transcript_9164/g.37570  ORF Transcript_9164/g.37570 Transcript_9164/m.37570 type:complete len:80 (-) Transcript_9164:984-1223(-)
MLSSGVRSKGPIGAPQMMYGRILAKVLNKFNIPFGIWHVLAQDCRVRSEDDDSTRTNQSSESIVSMITTSDSRHVNAPP